MFAGFHRPRSNFYRLPNDWFDHWRTARAARPGGRIVGPLKATEYVIKWSWGYQNFDRPVRISWHHFQHGRLAGQERLDRGTGLSSRSLGEALDTALALGFLERHGDPRQPTYLPHLRPAAEDTPGFLADDPAVATAGFAPPRANYFLVPALWTDLTADVSSEALILAVEYLFRHTWGWDGGWERPCWLTAEEIAAGRRYRSPDRAGERYDAGIGYAERTLRDALAEGIRRGWLVWQETENGGRIYALHLQGMQVAEDGRFLALANDAADERAPAPPASAPLTAPTTPPSVLPPAPAPPSSAPAPAPHSDRVAQLAAQVRSLTQEVQALRAALAALMPPACAPGTAGTAESKAAPAESKAALAESKAPTAESTAGNGGKYSTSDTDTPDTPQTPPADTRPAHAAGAEDGLPADLRQLLLRLDYRGQQPWAELASAYQVDPTRIGGWIRYLDTHRHAFQQPAGFLLQTVVRDGAPLPIDVPPASNGNGSGSSGSCPVCGGRGRIRPDLPSGDPDYGRAVPCPRCGGQGDPPIGALISRRSQR